MLRWTINDLLGSIKGSARDICLKILEDNNALFHTIQGASHNHQAWTGGYIDHVVEVMNIALNLYPTMNSMRPLPFKLSDALLILFLHDIEKPWKYEIDEAGGLRFKEALRTKQAQHEFRMAKLKEYGLELTDDQLNALTYVEGELNDWSHKRRAMGPLAAFCHMCDVASARIWFDYPAESGDPWHGASRQAAGRPGTTAYCIEGKHWAPLTEFDVNPKFEEGFEPACKIHLKDRLECPECGDYPMDRGSGAITCRRCGYTDASDRAARLCI